MFLVGRTKSDGMFPEYPMLLSGMTKNILSLAKEDSNYLVADLLNQKIFDPNKNKWVKMEMREE